MQIVIEQSVNEILGVTNVLGKDEICDDQGYNDIRVVIATE